ncbi:MAG: hypothetical protein LBL39_03635 [Planctomycetaceae bacterium]|jgi:hypothetical protein|nr:hypothetical protein [Planctomycetaceae bacterium]
MKFRYCALVLVFVCLIGCTKSDPRKAGLVPVGGTITYNGSVLGNATVVFMPKDSNKQGAGGLSDASGKFKLTTISDQDGAYAGEYAVYVLKEEQIQISDEEMLEYSRNGQKPPQAKSLIPTKYTNPANPIINLTIPPTGDKNILIELKD